MSSRRRRCSSGTWVRARQSDFTSSNAVVSGASPRADWAAWSASWRQSWPAGPWVWWKGPGGGDLLYYRTGTLGGAHDSQGRHPCVQAPNPSTQASYGRRTSVGLSCPGLRRTQCLRRPPVSPVPSSLVCHRPSCMEEARHVSRPGAVRAVSSEPGNASGVSPTARRSRGGHTADAAARNRPWNGRSSERSKITATISWFLDRDAVN